MSGYYLSSIKESSPAMMYDLDERIYCLQRSWYSSDYARDNWTRIEFTSMQNRISILLPDSIIEFFHSETIS